MRVLHLTRDFPPRHCGGLSTAVAGLAYASRRAGVDVAVLSFDAWRPSLPRIPPFEKGGPGGISRRSTADNPPARDDLPTLRLATPADLPAARAFAADWRPDVLHVHDAMLWPFAADLRAGLGVPAAFTVHVAHRAMNALRGAPHTASLAAQEEALAHADRIIFPSAAARAVVIPPVAVDPPTERDPFPLVEKGGSGEIFQPTSAAEHQARDHSSRPDEGNQKIPPDPPSSKGGKDPAGILQRDVIAPHGIDDSDVARAALGGAREPLLLAVGRFDDVKGTPELFAVLREALRRLPTATALIAGGLPASPRAETRWRAQWERDKPAALGARVHFTGWLPSAALAALYARAAAVVIPSRFETFGLAALEAMLHGAPVAATDAGALPELIAHGETGLLSPVGDVAALAEHVVALVEDAALAARLTATAAAEIRAQWLWQHRLPAVLSAYGAVGVR